MSCRGALTHSWNLTSLRLEARLESVCAACVSRGDAGGGGRLSGQGSPPRSSALLQITLSARTALLSDPSGPCPLLQSSDLLPGTAFYFPHLVTETGALSLLQARALLEPAVLCSGNWQTPHGVLWPGSALSTSPASGHTVTAPVCLHRSLWQEAIRSVQNLCLGSSRCVCSVATHTGRKSRQSQSQRTHMLAVRTHVEELATPTRPPCSICVFQSSFLVFFFPEMFLETNQVSIIFVSWLDNVPDGLSLWLHN